MIGVTARIEMGQPILFTSRFHALCLDALRPSDTRRLFTNEGRSEREETRVDKQKKVGHLLLNMEVLFIKKVLHIDKIIFVDLPATGAQRAKTHNSKSKQ